MKRPRGITTVLVVFLLAVPSGCGKQEELSTPPAVAQEKRAATRTPNAADPGETDASSFDPKLRLEWPAPPSESRRRIDAGSPDETTIYSATLTLSDPATIFSATVHQFTEASLRDQDPRVVVAKTALRGDDGLARHSPYVANKAYEINKWPGLEVTAKSGSGFARRVVVLAGTRLYQIEVVSTKEDRLRAEDVARFFESFGIDD